MLTYLYRFFQGDMSFLEVMISLLAAVFVVFCTMPVHEYAHAKVAVLLGDDTPRLTGRLSLNPMRHIDLLGALMIFLVGFGYAKPVQINSRNFKNPRGGMALTALAGPVANLLMAFVFLLFYSITVALFDKTQSLFFFGFSEFFLFAGTINISLAVFNLLPVPPLDGSRIATLLLPAKYYYRIMQYERYIMIGIFVLLFTGLLTRPLSYLVNQAENLMLAATNAIAELIF